MIIMTLFNIQFLCVVTHLNFTSDYDFTRQKIPFVMSSALHHFEPKLREFIAIAGSVISFVLQHDWLQTCVSIGESV